MRKFLRVLTYEYTRHVWRWRFFVSLLSLPIMVCVFGLIMLLGFAPELAPTTIGYVDYAHLLKPENSQLNSWKSIAWITILPFETEQQAQAAMDAGRIHGYYVLPEDYKQTSEAFLISRKQISDVAQANFRGFVQASLLADLPEQIAERLSSRDEITTRSLDGKQTANMGDLVSLVLPAAICFLLVISIFSASGYLVKAIAEERQNRTMELLITSTSPGSLIAGKTIGLIAVGLTQVGIWISPLIVLFLTNIDYLKNLGLPSLSASTIGTILASLATTLITIAALMVSLGVIMRDEKEGQVIASIFFLPIYVPLAALTQILNHPNSSLAVALSYFPLTSPVTLSLRMMVTTIPSAQIALNLLALALLAFLTIWLASYSWRLGMFAYGRRVSWRELIGKQP